MAQTGLLFVGIAGTVVALDRGTGQEVWPATGNIRWQNRLQGLGRGLLAMATSGSRQAVVMGEKKQRDEAAAAATSAAIG